MQKLNRLIVTGLVVVGIVMLAQVAGQGTIAARALAAETEQTSAGALDQLIMMNGAIIQGEIVEETETEVHIIVVINGIRLKSPTTYDKAEILDIKHDHVAISPKAKRHTANRIEEQLASGDDDGAKLYVVELEGVFGQDVSVTPMREIFEDVDKVFGDIIEVDDPGGLETRTVVHEDFRDRHIVVLKMDTGGMAWQGFDSLWVAEDIGPVVEEQMVERGRRVVFWIENAVDGAAFFPWISPEIYFTREGWMGVRDPGDLEDFSSGDRMVDEKQISLRIGHAEGFAVKGGYDPIFIKPMARRKYWLCVRWEGGNPIFIQEEPTPEQIAQYDWTILTDDGEGEYKDTKALVGNDRLFIEAEIAEKLKISKGTCDSVEDLAFELGVHRNWVEVDKDEMRGDDILADWRDDIAEAYRMVLPAPPERRGKLWREFDRIEVQGDYNDRKRARGRQLRLLKQISAIVARYAEVIDPNEQFRAQLRVLIEEISQAQQRDKLNNRGRGGGGRGGGGGVG